MVMHLRVCGPGEFIRGVREQWSADERLTNLSHMPGALVRPEGDVLEADLPRETVSFIMDDLRAAGLEEVGAFAAISEPEGAVGAGALEAQRAAGGDPDDAVVWSLLEARADDASRPTPTYLLFLCAAVMLAGIAVLTDSAVLVVGAMVVGPDFAPVAAACTGVVLGRWRLAGHSLWLLLWSYVLAVAVVTLGAFLALQLGWFSVEDVLQDRPQTGFIWRPNLWSFLVAVLAGAVGAWAMATEKSQAMVGVFISVTTVPAVGNLTLGWPSARQRRSPALRLSWA